MRKIIKAVYRCGFCYQEEDSKEDILEHEKKCCGNPVNKHCYTCEHLNLEGDRCFLLSKPILHFGYEVSEYDLPLPCNGKKWKRDKYKGKYKD